MGDMRDGRKGFAAETISLDGSQVGELGNLRGRVTFAQDGEICFLLNPGLRGQMAVKRGYRLNSNAASVVLDLKELEASLLYSYANLLGSRIERVL